MPSFFTSYVTAALATLPGGPHSAASIEPRTMAQMKLDCEKFCEDNKTDLAFLDKAHAGRLFWEHRAGHVPDIPAGATRSYRLTEAAKAFGPYTLAIGEGGMIHGSAS